MSLTGVCQHCERAPASHACPNCGTLVCDRHFDRQRNRCASCLSGMR